MLRISFSFIGSFVLFYIQCLIVMKVFHYETIYFDSLSQTLTVCAVNFFLVFSMITQLTPWFAKRGYLETEEE